MRNLVALLVVTLAVAPAALAAHKPPTSGVHHTDGGDAAARRALLRASDLGSGWSAGATPKKAGPLTCGTAKATVEGVIETGSAISPTYRESSSGPFVSQAAYVYRSGSEAKTFWQHVSGRSALACLARSLAAGSTKDVTFKLVKEQSLTAPPTGADAVAYRVAGTAAAAGQKVDVYVDVVLLHRGSMIAEVSFSSFQMPPDSSLEAHAARAVTNRL